MIEVLNMKKILKGVIFIFIFGFIWNKVFSILWIPKNNISSFYDEPRNTLDVIYIGSSYVHHHYNPLLAYDMYGYTTGLLSTGLQPFVSTQYLIDETLKYQKPKLFIIDITKISDDFEGDFKEEWSRTVIDSMKLSKNKLDLINKILTTANIDKKEYINYYLSFFKYHNAWKDINAKTFYNVIYKGYYFYPPSFEINPQEEYIWDSKIIDLPLENKKVLLNLFNYIKSNNLNVLFVIPKSRFWFPNQEMLNDAVSIINENGFDVINFSNMEDLKISSATDFYDDTHLNVYGATKYTLYLANYIKEHYFLDNHKGEPLYESWENEYKKFKDDFKTVMGQDFNEFLVDYK